MDIKIEDNTFEINAEVKGTGGSEVTKAYVDNRDDTILTNAKEYTEERLNAITIPKKVSELENDKGYLNAHQDISFLASKASLGIVEENVQNNSNVILTVSSKVDTKQDKLTAGDNVEIVGNVINAKGGSTYDDTALRNLIATKTNHEYVDNADALTLAAAKIYTDEEIEGKQDKLTAGSNITISGNVISSTGGSGSSYDDTEVRGLIKTNKDNIATNTTNIANKVDKVTGKDLFSGSYTDLTNKPTIPTAYDDTAVRGLITDNKNAIATKVSKSELGTEITDYVTAHKADLKGDKGDKGETGLTGAKGDKGEQGLQGVQGIKGDTGEQGLKGDTGEQGLQGAKGETGEKGADGYTPVKGTDYYTSEDIAEFKQYIDDEILGGKW